MFRYAVLVCYLMVLFFLSLNPWLQPASGQGFFAPDKLDHALAYGGLSLIIFFCLVRSGNGYVRSTAHAWMAALLMSVFIGILVETAQGLFMHSRTGSMDDAAANAIGAALGCVAYFAAKSMRT